MKRIEAIKIYPRKDNWQITILPLVGILTLSDKAVLMIGWLCWGIDIIIKRSNYE